MVKYVDIYKKEKRKKIFLEIKINQELQICMQMDRNREILIIGYCKIRYMFFINIMSVFDRKFELKINNPYDTFEFVYQ